ncbi:NADPH-dependent FMN reductase [Prauserella sp. PE36]|uniref:NAD(P)H-dependent oxidoreductase n=1 Tax=Prauserella endophytica TaxID=1592324 RepID=A0ABY2S5F9_9PSEU|nr:MULTISPECIES: NAD(P)H-dependent oxidoreductase [Prauserella]PXY23475.1 NADPH-dependent FMN reductase [Prauserella coralliicola]RBM18319.1 NADPH-dependent FMN reductase [Prauserella sp. PE36]TKG70538.1 NAD(P)H-dependent oxidoreductase [Prauserella endophytica]
MTASENTTALRVAVIIGSTRKGRVGDNVAHWFAGLACEREDLDVAVVDLADFELPAQLPAETTDDMARLAARIGESDAFVVVTPEYNRSFPASLKQAIDVAYDEWHGKPAGFVSYGCRSAGLYAVEQLRCVFIELHVVTMRDTVSFDLFADDVDDSGRPADDGETARTVTAMLDQLVWWGRALRAARAERPYVT